MIALAGALLAVHARSSAQPTAAKPTPLEMPITVDRCVPVDVTAFQRQLAIELEAAPQASDLARAQTSTRISLRCHHREQIAVEVADSVARRTWRRKVELRGVDPRAHTRLLALSVAELLLASWLELRMDRQADASEARVDASSSQLRGPQSDGRSSPFAPQSEARSQAPAPSSPFAPQTDASERAALDTPTQPEGRAQPDPRSSPFAPQPDARERVPRTTRPDARGAEPLAPEPEAHSSQESNAPSPSTRDQAPEPDSTPPPSAAARSSLLLGAAATASAFTSSFALIPGGELHLNVPLSATWALRCGAQAGHGNLSGSGIGELGREADVRITTASVALSLHALTRTGDFELGFGAGVRAGLAHLAGVLTDHQLLPARAFAPWTGPLIAPSVSYRLSAAIALTLGLELGWMAVRVRALAPEGKLVTELRGVWMLATLGLDFAL